MPRGSEALPLVPNTGPAEPRPSRNAPKRAIVLAAVNLLFVAHGVHYLVRGRTLSPVEPSEAMYTLEQGAINAGFVFFVLALSSTLIFGRFFCGWGCHLVALQDLCGWIMGKLGVRPRPFRSRVLGLVPLGLALYMFVWPTFKRVALLPFLDRAWPAALAWVRPMADFPGFTNHLTTGEFWKTFPGPWFAVLTLATCGFAVVYFLGSKGFCTYGCPYGGFFAPLDRLAPMRVRVSDACRQCGHCTATCTSNVQVHEEVRQFGMVVDPGCMKCTDCVSVCPEGALSVGFGKPAIFAGKSAARGGGRGIGFPAELLVGSTFLVSMLALRGLYDGPPLLMAVGLAGITAMLALKCSQIGRRERVRLQNLSLKSAGRLTWAGKLFLALAVVWFGFVAHSGFVQWHRFRGGQSLERTEAGRDEVLRGAAAARSYSAEHDRATQATLHHFQTADRYGLHEVGEIKLGLAWGYLLTGEFDAALEEMRSAIRIAPEHAGLRDDLVLLLASRGRLDEAAGALQEKIAQLEPEASDFFHLAALQIQIGRPDEAVAAYRACLERVPDSAEAHYNLGGLLRRQGRSDEALAELSRAAELAPDDPATRVELGLALAGADRREEALEELRLAIRLDPESPESRLHLPRLIRELEGEGGQ